MRDLFVFIFLLLTGMFVPAASYAESVVVDNAAQPVVRAVLFRADWCANCHILEPILEQAMMQVSDVPVELVVLDFTDPASWDNSIETALDHDVVKVYNAYAGVTGLVVLTAVDTGERIGCFNRTFSAPAMVHSMKTAVSTSLSLPRGQRDTGSILCPPGRAPL